MDEVASPWREAVAPEAMERLRAAADERDHERLLETVLREVIRPCPKQVEALRGAVTLNGRPPDGRQPLVAPAVRPPISWRSATA